jgi:polar amino acid transport system permease protein
MEIKFFTGLQFSDLGFLGEAALKTLMVSGVAIGAGTLLGILFGWILYQGRWVAAASLGLVLDAFRSVPLIIQLVLFFNLFPILGLPLEPFTAGAIVLAFYTSALVASIVQGGIEAVEKPMRRAARSLGMSYWQDMIYVVWPIGLRAVFPSWVGVALSVIKDSALVSVLGYVELLRASQILMTRTQEPFIILSVVGAIYFAISFPLGLYGQHLEKKWSS